MFDLRSTMSALIFLGPEEIQDFFLAYPKA
jgi:hypothetical protein